MVVSRKKKGDDKEKQKPPFSLINQGKQRFGSNELNIIVPGDSLGGYPPLE